MIPFPKKKREPSFSKIDLNKFQCKLLKKINLNECLNYTEGSQPNQNEIKVGSAWSGINKQINNIPQFCYGTENGLLVRFIIKKYQMSNTQIDVNSSITDKLDKPTNQVQILKNKSFIIENPQIDEIKKYVVNMEILKIVDQDIPCYQVGQIKDCIILSHTEDNKFKLKLFDSNFNEFLQLQSYIASYIFTRTHHNLLIYRSRNQQNAQYSLVFCKIVGQNEKQLNILNKINLNKAKFTPNTMLTYKDFLFVGLSETQINMYSIKKRKLIRILNPCTLQIPKKMVYSKKSGIIAVVSKNDQIVFINIFNGSLLCSYQFEHIFNKTDMEFNSSFEIYLFQFLSPDIVAIGGSFPYLIFFDWKSNKITHIYKDYNNFVGIIIYNDLLILTHEKNPMISIIQ